MIRVEEWHYLEVPRLGSVVISRGTLADLRGDQVNDTEIAETLEKGRDVLSRQDPTYRGREHGGVRLVFRNVREASWGSAAVCVDGYRVK